MLSSVPADNELAHQFVRHTEDTSMPSTAALSFSPAASQTRKPHTDWLLLLALLLLAPLLYLPCLAHNLPVAANVDERNALEILHRFQHGSLNPHFFMYPTLYFYLLHAVLLPFHFSNILALQLGRLFNLTLIGLTAFLTFAFCRDRLHSRSAGFIAAFFVLGSTILSDVASYLHPDLLMTASGMASLYLLTRFFENHAHHTPDRRAWLLGMVFLGLSVGCKYTAFLLYLAYFAAEALSAFRSPHRPEARFSLRACLRVLHGLSLALALAAVFFPTQSLLHFIATARSAYDPKPAAYYLVFLHHIRHTLFECAALTALLAVLCRLSRTVYNSLSLKRLYLGLAIILGVNVLCTPFALLQPKAFLFDLGALARSNLVVSGGHAQWLDYLLWMLHDEGPFLLILSALGALILAHKIFSPHRLLAEPRRHLTFAALYVALYLLTIGSAPLGFVRYLAPVLPLLYCAAGLAAARLWRTRPAHDTPLHRAIVCLLLTAAALQTTLHLLENRRNSTQTNVFYASYQHTLQAHPQTVFYAGFAPSLELQQAGLPTHELSWPSLLGHPLAQNLTCSDILILEKARAADHHIDARRDPSVTLLLDDDRSTGQQVLRKTSCP